MLGADAGHPEILCWMKMHSGAVLNVMQWYAAGLCKECDPFTDYILQCGSVQWSCEECSGGKSHVCAKT